LAILFASFGWANICNINQYSSPFDVSACTNREQTTYHKVVFFIVPFNMAPAFLMRPTNEKGDTCKKNRPLFRQYLVTKPSQRKKFRLKVVEKQIIYNTSRGTFSPRTHISLDIWKKHKPVSFDTVTDTSLGRKGLNKNSIKLVCVLNVINRQLIRSK